MRRRWLPRPMRSGTPGGWASLRRLRRESSATFVSRSRERTSSGPPAPGLALRDGPPGGGGGVGVGGRRAGPAAAVPAGSAAAERGGAISHPPRSPHRQPLRRSLPRRRPLRRLAFVGRLSGGFESLCFSGFECCLTHGSLPAWFDGGACLREPLRRRPSRRRRWDVGQSCDSGPAQTRRTVRGPARSSPPTHIPGTATQSDRNPQHSHAPSAAASRRFMSTGVLLIARIRRDDEVAAHDVLRCGG